MNSNINKININKLEQETSLISDEVLMDLYNSLPENILLFLNSSFPQSKRFEYFKLLVSKLLKSNDDLNSILNNIHSIIPEISRCILKFSTILTLNIMEISNSTKRKHIKMANFLELPQ